MNTVLPPLSLASSPSLWGGSLVQCGGPYGDLFPGIDVHMPLPGHFNFFLFVAFLKKSA